jgi:hypothetical protein
MMRKFLWLCVMLVLALPLFAQERNFQLQLFTSEGVTVNRATGAKSDVWTGGFGFVAPKKTKFFGKAFGAAGNVFALNPAKPTPRVPVLQLGALVGYRATTRLSLLTGYFETMQFPSTSGNLYLPTFVAVTAMRIHGHWAVFTPCTVNEKSWGCSGQLAYVF